MAVSRPWRPAWREGFAAVALSLEGVPANALPEALEARDLWPAATHPRRYAPDVSLPGDPLFGAKVGLLADELRVTDDPKRLLLAALRGAMEGVQAAAAMQVRAQTAAVVRVGAQVLPALTTPPSLASGAILGGLTATASHLAGRALRGQLAEAPTRSQALTLAALGPCVATVEAIALELQTLRAHPVSPPVVIWRVADLSAATPWRLIGHRVTRSRLAKPATAGGAMARDRRRSATDPIADRLWEVWRAGCAVERVTDGYVVIAAPRWRPPGAGRVRTRPTG